MPLQYLRSGPKYQFKKTSELPPLQEDSITYDTTRSYKIEWVAFTFLSQCISWVGLTLFLPINTGKPIFFVFWVAPFLVTHILLRQSPVKIVRHANSLEFFNIYGRSFKEHELSNYDSFGIEQKMGCRGEPCFVFVPVLNRELVDSDRKSCWGMINVRCCMQPRLYEYLELKDIDRFAKDHGLIVENVTVVQYVQTA